MTIGVLLVLHGGQTNPWPLSQSVDQVEDDWEDGACIRLTLTSSMQTVIFFTYCLEVFQLLPETFFDKVNGKKLSS